MSKKYKFDTVLYKNDSHLYPLQFPVPNDIVTKLKHEKVERLKVSVNVNDAYDSSLISNGDQEYFIKINQQQIKKMNLNIGDQVSMTVVGDESVYGMPLPEEFAVIWEIDQDAHTYFHALTPGKQRNLIYIVNKVKSLNIRARKATIIMEHLKINNGKLDFKMLNESLKVNQ